MVSPGHSNESSSGIKPKYYLADEQQSSSKEEYLRWKH
jgi:hypothetical protein